MLIGQLTLFKIISASLCHKLTALIGVENLWFVSSGAGLSEGGEHEMAIMSLTKPPGNNLSCGKIFNRCQIPNRASIHNTAQVAAPHLISLGEG